MKHLREQSLFLMILCFFCTSGFLKEMCGIAHLHHPITHTHPKLCPIVDRARPAPTCNSTIVADAWSIHKWFKQRIEKYEPGRIRFFVACVWQISTCARAYQFDAKKLALLAFRRTHWLFLGAAEGVWCAYPPRIETDNLFRNFQNVSLELPAASVLFLGCVASRPKFFIPHCVWEKSGARSLVKHIRSSLVERNSHEGLAAQPSPQAHTAATPRTAINVCTKQTRLHTRRHHCRHVSLCVKKGIDRLQLKYADSQLLLIFA